MNKQNALTLLFTSLFISQNIHTQEKPKGPGSSRKTHPHSSKVNSALETFGAVTCSDDIEELPSDFCKATLKRVPEKYKKRVNFTRPKGRGFGFE